MGLTLPGLGLARRLYSSLLKHGHGRDGTQERAARAPNAPSKRRIGLLMRHPEHVHLVVGGGLL